jgi:hypothetical protein
MSIFCCQNEVNPFEKFIQPITGSRRPQGQLRGDDLRQQGQPLLRPPDAGQPDDLERDGPAHREAGRGCSPERREAGLDQLHLHQRRKHLDCYQQVRTHITSRKSGE